jgi:hypothetical protein
MNSNFSVRQTSRFLIVAAFATLAAAQTGCTFFPALGGDPEVQAAVERAADDPFPSAKQAGLTAKEET